jgi:hypothetical protein
MIIENPITDKTSIAKKPKVTSKVRNKLNTVSSITINQIPLFNKKDDNCFFVFFLPERKAEVPDKKTKTGAQK